MTKPENQNSHWLVRPAAIDIDTQGVPHATAFADVYYSDVGGLAESRHVFLQHNQLEQRWRALDESSRDFIIIETGFGTGLNFLAAAELWLATAPAHCQLRFISVEKFPLARADMQRVFDTRTQFSTLCNELLAQYPPLLRGHHNLVLAGGRIHLQLIFDEAVSALTQLLESDYPAWPQADTRCADAFFLDGFAPAKNPAMWSTELFQAMARLCKPGTTFATFTCAGDVRRGLAAVGFDVSKVGGFGRKRDMLCGNWQQQTSAHSFVPSPRSRQKFGPLWAVTESQAPQKREAMVIGAGLAGAHTAFALAQRGWQVTVVDAASDIAAGASGNAQGVLYTKLSAQPDNVSRFALASYIHALRSYRCLLTAGTLPANSALLCGVLYAGHDEETRLLHAAVSNAFAQAPEITQTVSAAQASAIAGIDLQHAALWMPDAGFLVPPAVCRALLAHPSITLLSNTRITQLTRHNNEWQANTADGRELHAPTVILCTANDARQLQQTAHLPLKPVRGQTTQLPACAISAQLSCVICHDGYLPPARDGQHCIGATFDSRRSDTDTDAADHTDNLARLALHLPTLAQHAQSQNAAALTGRAALRCTTPDYLPIVGPVADVPQMLQRFAPLADNAQTQVACPGAVLHGLYINVGHGSRGLSSTPLAAALLLAYIEQTPFPLDATQRINLHPARFLIRDLIRKRAVTYT